MKYQPRYPLILAPRGYVSVDGTWRHVYIRESFQQVDIFGDNIPMLRVQLSKGSKVLHPIEESKLHKEKPRQARAERVN